MQYLRELASPPLMRQGKSFRAQCVRPLASRSPLPPLSPCSFRARHADLEWANLAEGRLRLDRLPATAAGLYAGRGEIEFGAAWRKTSNEGREYLSVKLDDPSFPTPIYASLVEVEGEDGLSLIWSRRNAD